VWKSKFFSGLPLIIFGLWLIVYVFAFTSMMGDDLEGEKWWRELASKYLNNQQALIYTISGLVFVLIGLVLCVWAFIKR
jgi:hypothetical protein